MNRKLKFLALPAAGLAAVLVGTLAWAYWTTGGTGSASASVGDLGAPANVSGLQRGTDPIVDVAWSGVPAPDGGAVDGYRVERRAGLGGSWQDACGTSSSALDTDGPGCADTNLAAATYYYRVTAIFRTWTARSAESAGVPVVLDTTAPEFVPAPTVVSDGPTFGSNPLFVTNAKLTLSSAATDAQTGVAEVRYYHCAGSTGTCTNGTLIGSSTAGPNYPYAWTSPALADGPYRIVAVAQDNAGNVSTPSPNTLVTVDTAPPTVETPTVNG